MLRKLTVIYTLLAALIISPMAVQVVYAQDQQCEGDPEMCSQVIELKHQLEVQKQLAAKASAGEQETGDKTAKMIALAAAMAVILKLLVSLASSWKGYFKTDKQKAALKIGLVVSGFVIFLATNVGMGINWWQSLILAGGGPGSILVHELAKLLPVLQGKKKYNEVDPDGDPTTSLPPNS